MPRTDLPCLPETTVFVEPSIASSASSRSAVASLFDSLQLQYITSHWIVLSLACLPYATFHFTHELVWFCSTLSTYQKALFSTLTLTRKLGKATARRPLHISSPESFNWQRSVSSLQFLHVVFCLSSLDGCTFLALHLVDSSMARGLA